MIRVFSGTTPLSSKFNRFHQTVAVSDGKFAVNSGSSGPTPTGVFGVDKPDPQPTFYPANTTFFISTSASRPLATGLSVGTTYFLLTPGKTAGDTSLTIQAEGGYSGSVQKVYNSNDVVDYPLDLSLFVDPPLGVYYLRLYDQSDPVDIWESGNQTNRWVAATPRSLGLTTAEQVQAYRGIVRVVSVAVSNSPTMTVRSQDSVVDVPYVPWGPSTPLIATSFLVLSVVEAA